MFLTGHTGFKGSWLSIWLQQLGASVTGYALAPPTKPSLFEAAAVSKGMHHVEGDVGDFSTLRDALHRSTPEIVIHLAAQPLVGVSYQDPLTTYRTNVLGTANLLEAIRTCSDVRSVVVITSDKCYENREWAWPYRENDRLGGHDPYSCSKACAELVAGSYRSCFFSTERYGEHGVAIATARAGNAIGGGDWADHRLIPDIVRSFANGETANIRNPSSIRPWQHVLEPLRGYLMLAEKLYQSGIECSGGWNFGPRNEDTRSVDWVVHRVSSLWGFSAELRVDSSVQTHAHEAKLLRLDSSKAASELHWQPAWSLDQALDCTVDWYRRWYAGEPAAYLARLQIERYSNCAQFSPALVAA